MPTSAARRRRRLTPIALLAGVLGSAVLGLGATGTYSGLTATITNSTNTAGTGSLVMQEADDASPASVSCTSNGAGSSGNSATCADPNLYGGSSSLTPGGAPSTRTVRISDTGTLDPTSFTVSPGTCTSSNGATGSAAGNICNWLRLTLTCTPVTGSSTGSTITVYSAQTLSSIAGTAPSLTNGCLPTKNAGTYARLAFSVQLDSGAPNDVQGATATQPVVWQFMNVT